MKFLHRYAASIPLCAAALVGAVPNPDYNIFLPADYNLNTASLQPPRALDIAFSPDNTHLAELDDFGRAIQPPIDIPRDASVQLAHARRKNTKGSGGGCGLPICGGEASYYMFGPQNVVFCGSSGQHSSSVKLVALPAWFMHRSYCGKYMILSRTDASGRVHTTRALIGDKCPNESCHRRNNRIDLSEAAFNALGGTRAMGVLPDVQWRID